MTIISGFTVIVSIGLVFFIFGYFIGLANLKKITDAHREYEAELKKQRDEYRSRLNYLLFGNSDGNYTFAEKDNKNG